MLRSRLRVAELAHNIVYAVAHDALAGEFTICNALTGCVEANSLGKAKSDPNPCSFELVLRERQQAAQITIPYKLIWHTTPKLARIQAIEPYYSNGQLRFLDTWNQDYPELMEQLIHYPLAAHDGGPDALAGAISLILAKEKARRQVLIPRAR